MVTPLYAVWEESTGPQGPHGGCDLKVYDADDTSDTPCPIYAQHFARQIAALPPAERAYRESCAKEAARALLRAAQAAA